MIGYVFGIATALVTSFQNSFYKKLGAIDTTVVNWWRFMFAAPFLAALVTIFSLWQTPPREFFLILLGLSLPLELLNSYFYISAFQRSPQSVVGPLFSLSAVFLIPLGFIFLGELPSVIGFFGIVSVLLGPLFLGWNDGGFNLFRSFRNIWREPGAWRMISAAFLAALAVTFSKYAYQFVTPLLFAFYIVSALAVATSVLLYIRNVSPFQAFNRNMFGTGFAYSIGAVLHFVGLNFLLAAYFISLKRLSSLFDVLFGYFMHREKHFGKRLFGAVLMVIGVVLILFA